MPTYEHLYDLARDAAPYRIVTKDGRRLTRSCTRAEAVRDFGSYPGAEYLEDPYGNLVAGARPAGAPSEGRARVVHHLNGNPSDNRPANLQIRDVDAP